MTGDIETNERASSTGGKSKLRLGLLLLAACCVIVIVVVPVVVTIQRKNQPTSTTTDGELHNINSAEEDAVQRDSSLSASYTQRSLSSYTDAPTAAPTTVALDDDVLFLADNQSSVPSLTLQTNRSNYSNNITLYHATNSTQTNASVPTTTNAASLSTTSPPSTLTPTTSETFVVTASPTTTPPTPSPTPRIATQVNSFVILETIPHDSNAFTQGLTFDPDNSSIVYESTGLYGQSDVRIVDISSGQVLLERATPTEIFGEGLAYYETDDGQGRLIHITWTSQRGFIFDAETLDLLQEFSFSTTLNEGWGITYNPNTDEFIVTDGSNMLHFWDRSSLTELRRVGVTLRTPDNPEVASDVRNLNEIEWDDTTQTILSNVWQTDLIVRIDPISGEVITVYDLRQLYPNRIASADVLNGIAISPDDELWITGKWWPNMYKIQFNE